MSPYFIRKTRATLITIVTVCTILGASAAIIAYGRGYRVDLKKTSLTPTGLISATSDPIAAQVYINDTLKTATNNSFNLEPGWYKVKIAKEGYIPWEKEMRIQGEVVSRADAFLFPSNPSLSPLTRLGVERPILSPDGSKVAYIIPTDHLDGNYAKKSGLWTYELSEGTLGRNRDAVQLAAFESAFDVTKATVLWSPDSTKVLTQTKNGTARLYQLARPGSFEDVTLSVKTLLSDWEEERNIKERQKLAAYKPPIIAIATASARIISFSPDETKILYEATASATIPQVIDPPLIGTNSTQETRTITPGNMYVYDSKEDKNYFLLTKKELQQSKLVWFPTSRHILLTFTGKIDIMEYDRTNWITIYSGPFVDGFVAPWSNGSRIIIMTSLNGDATSLPNLYTVNLR
jgi:PEGA domain